MDADLDSLATALYVQVDVLLTSFPYRVPFSCAVGVCGPPPACSSESGNVYSF